MNDEVQEILLKCLNKIGDAQGNALKYNAAVKVAKNMLDDAMENSSIFRYAIRLLATASPHTNVSALWTAIENELCADEKYKQLRSDTVKDIRGVDDATDVAKGVADTLHKKDTPRLKNWAELSDEESNATKKRKLGISGWCDTRDDDQSSRPETKEKETPFFRLSTGLDASKPFGFGSSTGSHASNPFGFGSSTGSDTRNPFGFGSSTGSHASNPFGFGSSKGSDTRKPFGFGLSKGSDASQSFGFGFSTGSDARNRFSNSFSSSRESWKTRDSDESTSVNTKAFFRNSGESANDNPFKTKSSTFSRGVGSKERVQILDAENHSTEVVVRDPKMWTLEQRKEMVDAIASEVAGMLEPHVQETAKAAAKEEVDRKTAELRDELTNTLRQNTAELKEVLAEGFKSSSTKPAVNWIDMGLLMAPEQYTEEEFFGSCLKVRLDYNDYKNSNKDAIHKLLDKLKGVGYPFNIVIGYAYKNPLSPMGRFMIQLEQHAIDFPKTKKPRAAAGATKKPRDGHAAEEEEEGEEGGSDHEPSEAERAAFKARTTPATTAATGDLKALIAEAAPFGTRSDA